VAAGLASGLVLFFVSCASTPPWVNESLEIPGAHYVGNQTCMDCHTNIVRQFVSSAHSRLYLADINPPGGSGCESCHGPGSKHVEAGGGREKFIINPGREPEACFRCHLRIRAEFDLPVHHPVIEKHMNCVQCHDPHGSYIMKSSGGLAMARLNQTCAQCHREQTRPFVFEHPAMREGCTTCHNPHGSINRMLLTQADNNLCLRCHAQRQSSSVPAGQIYIGQSNHTFYLQTGGCWTAGCHTAVHGSDIDPRLRY
jgi:predicted CXXCH cytochrome family protein